MEHELFSLLNTDEQILEYLKASVDITEWNMRRQNIKVLRSEQWITLSVDTTGLITQCSFAEIKSRRKFLN